MIPVVDCKNGTAQVGSDILTAIENVGFVYLTNHGIDQKLIDSVYAMSDKFWELSLETKRKYERPSGYNQGNTGYVGINVEILDRQQNKAEIREAFNVTPSELHSMAFPDTELAQFRPLMLHFFNVCWNFSKELLHTMAVQLKLDEDFFENTHKEVGWGHNATSLRLLHYPPLPDHIPERSARCGEHSDYGTITLLFQDSVGGLEVKNRLGQFVAADPLEGAILINTGDLLQRWTSDALLAVKHRVLVPENRCLWKSERRSLAFFVHPDDKVLISPLDGSDKYSPITAQQHLVNMFAKSY